MSTPTKISKPPISRSRNAIDARSAEAWHSSTASEVIEAYTTADGQEGWEVWTDYLDARKDHPPLDNLLKNGEKSLLWAIPTALLQTETGKLVGRLGDPRSFRKRRARRRWVDEATAWLDAATIAPISPAHAYECIAWAYALPRLPLCLGEELWWKLVNHLVAFAAEARQSTHERDALVWQLLNGELPLALAYGLPEIRACHDFAPEAWAGLNAGLEELVDIEGIPRLDLIDNFPPLVACWLRACAIAETVQDGICPESAAERFELVLLSLARLTRADRNMLFAERALVVDRDLWRACSDLKLESPARRLTRNLGGAKSASKQFKTDKLPSPAMHSEEARLAVMRPNWSEGSPRLAVSYAGRETRIELVVRNEVVCSGEWRLAVECDGVARSLTGDWTNVCWYSDADVDFLEIEAPLGDGLRVQRHLLLTRQDDTLLAADAIISDRPGKISCQSTLPLATNVGFHSAAETREGRLVGDGVEVQVLPLALPEWRSDPRRGELATTSDGLTLRQQHDGTAAYVPLLLDLRPHRQAQAVTWRQLTVAEVRKSQPADVAVGFRAEIGKARWLIYRSLRDPLIRSVLGQQVKAEFLFGRLKEDGRCTRLL